MIILLLCNLQWTLTFNIFCRENNENKTIAGFSHSGVNGGGFGDEKTMFFFCNIVVVYLWSAASVEFHTRGCGITHPWCGIHSGVEFHVCRDVEFHTADVEIHTAHVCY